MASERVPVQTGQLRPRRRSLGPLAVAGQFEAREVGAGGDQGGAAGVQMPPSRRVAVAGSGSTPSWSPGSDVPMVVTRAQSDGMLTSSICKDGLMRTLLGILWVVLLGLAPALAAAGPVVAVLPFANHSRDAGWDPLGKGLADMMTTDLANNSAITVVERQRLADVLGELSIQQSVFIDPATAQTVGKGLGATHLVTGSLIALDPQLRLDVRLIAVDTGAVLVGEQVLGEKHRFFELQTELARKLQAALPGVDPSGSERQVETLEIVAEYGRALDETDLGDLDAASKRLAGLVREEPGFKLAQDRYKEVMKALMKVRKKRSDLLGEAEAGLVQRTRAWLKSHDAASKDEDEAEVTFGYRILLVQLWAQKMTKLAVEDDDHWGPYVPEEARSAYGELIGALIADGDALVAALDHRRAAGLKPLTFPELPDQDDDIADRLGNSSAGRWAFHNEARVRSELARFLVFGDLPAYAHGSLEPVPMALDARLGARALRYLDEAMAALPRAETHHLERESMRTYHLKAKVLATLGREAEAMAELQAGLDRFPTSEEFDGLQEYLEKLLLGE